MREIVGKVIGGSVGEKILIRFKNDKSIDVGDLLLIRDGDLNFFVKITNVFLSSQIPDQFIEEIAGQELEKQSEIDFFDKESRFYRIGEAKILKVIRKGESIPPRIIPNYFSDVLTVKSEDFDFINKKGEIEIGYLRLGTKYLKDVIISLPADKLISHHILIVAATGKGKSNFAKVFLRGLLHTKNYSAIVFDPHGEYWGDKNTKGLGNHPLKDRLIYFTPRDIPSAEDLVIFAEDLVPNDFFGIINLSEAQKEVMGVLYRMFGKQWIKTLMEKDPLDLAKEIVVKSKINVSRITLTTLRRKLSHSMELDNGLVFTLMKKDKEDIFSKIRKGILDRKIVIVDTSLVGEESERLISSTIVRRVFNYYRNIKQKDPVYFEDLPEVMILFEEAPRVLGKEVLKEGTNIFERIAREGRKFKVGLCAITQMPSLLPREVLSQMNTKVILGLPAPSDRSAVIESAPQNISDEEREIQMLDKGEAILTSPFIEFPIPVKIFKFEDILKEDTDIDVGEVGIG